MEQDWQSTDVDALVAEQMMKNADEDWGNAPAAENRFADQDVETAPSRSGLGPTQPSKPTRNRRQKQQTPQQKQVRQQRQQAEAKAAADARARDQQRLKNVCISDRSYANGGMNIDEMRRIAAERELDTGSGSRAEIRLALCREFYPEIAVEPTTLGGVDNVKVPGEKKKVRQYKNILPEDKEIKERMQRFCVFGSAYAEGGWNADQAREIASWFDINTKSPSGKELGRDELRDKICESFKYTKDIYVPSLYGESTTAKLSSTFDIPKLKVAMAAFTGELEARLKAQLDESASGPGIAQFYTFTKPTRPANPDAVYKGYPIIAMMQGPPDVEGNPAKRALPDHKTLLDLLSERVPEIYINDKEDKVSMVSRPGYEGVPVDFALLEEKGVVNVYAIWDIRAWANRARKAVRGREKAIVAKQYAKPPRQARQVSQVSQVSQVRQARQGPDAFDMDEFPQLR